MRTVNDLDEVDQKIILQLQLDGRTTYKELSRIIGYTSMGVKKRVEKLLEQDIIKVSALLNIAIDRWIMRPLRLLLLFLQPQLQIQIEVRVLLYGEKRL